MTTQLRYPASVYFCDEDQGYIALAPDLPGCSAFGETEADALAELRPAIEAWIEAATAAGNPIPPPSPLRVEPSASGRFLLRMPKSLHADLIAAAAKEQTSLNQYMVYVLSAANSARSVTSYLLDAARDSSATGH